MGPRGWGPVPDLLRRGGGRAPDNQGLLSPISLMRWDLVNPTQPAHAEGVSGEETAHLLAELVVAERLGQEAVRSRFLSVGAIRCRCPFAHDQNGYVPELRGPADELADFVSRVTGKQEIDAHQMRF